MSSSLTTGRYGDAIRVRRETGGQDIFRVVEPRTRKPFRPWPHDINAIRSSFGHGASNHAAKDPDVLCKSFNILDRPLVELIVGHYVQAISSVHLIAKGSKSCRLRVRVLPSHQVGGRRDGL